MNLASITADGHEIPAVVDSRRGIVQVRDICDGFNGDAMQVIIDGKFHDIVERAAALPDDAFTPLSMVSFTAPYRHPRLIWGIGLNYAAHARDLQATVPGEPASFIKADHTIIGPNEQIVIPSQSDRTTTEAELGIVIGRYCRNVEKEEAWSCIFGVVPVLDQTAEDILERNPRYLTRAKNFPTFFSFGPAVVPIDAALSDGSLNHVSVSTRLGSVHRTNTVSNMRYSPEFLVSFHSKMMPLYPGDIISPGTPGAIRIHPGDLVMCDIPGVGRLSNLVVAEHDAHEKRNG